ncbi:hypothetical protein LWI29_037244 [Acer saccharum]|uniref:Uncharacterized protein n=1 Tax=Acer saccharum TaxID=4024 RepID=A0AA39RLU4_ACESA|nr:hypothetical protein LWI29_037244 [Acer saccharum]
MEEDLEDSDVLRILHIDVASAMLSTTVPLLLMLVAVMVIPVKTWQETPITPPPGLVAVVAPPPSLVTVVAARRRSTSKRTGLKTKILVWIDGGEDWLMMEWER